MGRMGKAGGVPSGGLWTAATIAWTAWCFAHTSSLVGPGQCLGVEHAADGRIGRIKRKAPRPWVTTTASASWTATGPIDHPHLPAPVNVQARRTHRQCLQWFRLRTRMRRRTRPRGVPEPTGCRRRGPLESFSVAYGYLGVALPPFPACRLI